MKHWGHALVLGHARFSIILVTTTEQNAPSLRGVYGLDWPFSAYYHFAFFKFVATETTIGEGHKCKGIIRN